MSVLWELPQHRGHVDPDGFALDFAAVTELDDVQQAEFQWPTLALEAEGPADGLAAPDRLIDEETVAVEPLRARHLAIDEVSEQRFIEGPRRLATACRPGRPADDVMLNIRRQRGQHAGDVVARLE